MHMTHYNLSVNYCYPTSILLPCIESRAAEAKAKAHDLAQARKEAAKHGRVGFAGCIAGGGSNSHDYHDTPIEVSHEPSKPPYSQYVSLQLHAVFMLLW